MADLQSALALAPGDAQLAAALAAAKADAGEARADALLARRMQANRAVAQRAETAPSKAQRAIRESVQRAAEASEADRAAEHTREAMPGNAGGAPPTGGAASQSAVGVGRARTDAQLPRSAQANGTNGEVRSAVSYSGDGAPGAANSAGASQAACAQEGMGKPKACCEHLGTDSPAAASGGEARMAGARNSEHAPAGDAEARRAAAAAHGSPPQAGQAKAGGSDAATAGAGLAPAAQQPAGKPAEAAELARPRRMEQLVQRLRALAGSRTASLPGHQSSVCHIRLFTVCYVKICTHNFACFTHKTQDCMLCLAYLT